jgi:hypothetical protein
MTKKILFASLLCLGCFFKGNAQYGVTGQDIQQVQTAVPFLTIAPDSKASSMGEAGAATTPDVNSLYWNPAKYAFIKEDMGASFSYSPWLKNLVPDMSISYLTGFYRLDKQQTIAASLKYFSMGSIAFTNETGEDLGQQSPNEFCLDAAYARMLSNNFSLGIAFRYIRSDITAGQYVNGVETHAGNAYAADLSGYYTTKIKVEDKDADLAFGVNISNMGSKISYTDDSEKDFIPINLRIGSSFGYNMDDYNRITINLDANKLLVPSYTGSDTGSLSSGDLTAYRTVGSTYTVPEGMIRSFYDAEGGLKEELQEVILCGGVEWMYRNQFAVRAGYFNENVNKGNRKFATMGIGLKLNVFSIDISYLIPTSGRNNALSNTVRFSLAFDINNNKQKSKKR